MTDQAPLTERQRRDRVTVTLGAALVGIGVGPFLRLAGAGGAISIVIGTVISFALQRSWTDSRVHALPLTRPLTGDAGPAREDTGRVSLGVAGS